MISAPITKIAVPRGCGEQRVHGGLYSVLEVADDIFANPNAFPLEHFLIDAPMGLPEGFKVPKLGVLMFYVYEGENHFGPEAEALYETHVRQGSPLGTWHIMDMVGHSHYPHLSDFLVEAYKFGFSRRLSSTLPLERLTDQSLHILGHDRAIVSARDGGLEDLRLRQGLSAPCRVSAYQNGDLQSLPKALDPSHWSGQTTYPPTIHDPDGCVFDAWLFRDPDSHKHGQVHDPAYLPSLTEPYPVPRHDFDPAAVRFAPGFFARFPIQKVEMVINCEDVQPVHEEKFKALRDKLSRTGIKPELVLET